MIYNLRYTGEEIIDGKSRVRLKSGSIYRIDFGWNFEDEINGFWIFYVYDEIGKYSGKSFGFEISIDNIESPRKYNLESLLRTE